MEISTSVLGTDLGRVEQDLDGSASLADIIVRAQNLKIPERIIPLRVGLRRAACVWATTLFKVGNFFYTQSNRSVR